MAAIVSHSPYGEPYKLLSQVAISLGEPKEELLKLAQSVPELFKCVRLSFSGNKEADGELIAVWEKKCPKIQVLDISNLGPLRLSELPTMEQLTTLDLSSTPVNAAELASFLERQGTITSLTINQVNLSIKEIRSLFDKTPKLVSFSNIGNSNLVARDWAILQSELESRELRCALAF
jgi:hypothetical protein